MFVPARALVVAGSGRASAYTGAGGRAVRDWAGGGACWGCKARRGRVLRAAALAGAGSTQIIEHSNASGSAARRRVSWPPEWVVLGTKVFFADVVCPGLTARRGCGGVQRRRSRVSLVFFRGGLTMARRAAELLVGVGRRDGAWDVRRVAAALAAAVGVMVFGASGASGASGGSVAAEAARAWFDSVWEGGVDGTGASMVFVEWEARLHPEVWGRDLERLRRDVPGKPDHPQRGVLERTERRLASGPDVERHAAWLGERGEIRRRERIGTASENDLVLTDRLAWSAVGDALVVMDPRDGWPEGRRWGGHGRSTRQSLASFFDGALSIRAGGGHLEIDGFGLEGDRWWAEAAHEIGLRVRYEGLWDAARGVGRAESAEVVRSDPTPEEVGKRWEAREWSWREEAGGWVAGVLVELAPGGRVLREEVLVELSEVGERELREVLALPDFEGGGADPVLGEVEWASVTDFRRFGPERAEVRRRASPGGEWVVEGSPSGGGGGLPWRSVGVWLAVGCAVGLVVWVRLKRA